MIKVALLFFIYFCLSSPIFANTSSDLRLNVIQITTENASELVQSGPDAIGGINDWFITNGTLCGIVSDLEHEGEFSSKGGVLIDLGFCDRADDHLTFVQDLIDGKRSSPVNVKQIETESGDNWVSIITTAEQSGVTTITRYTLKEDLPTQLLIKKVLKVDDETRANFNLYSAAWFNYHSLETFLFSGSQSKKSRGFNNIDIVTRGISAIREAVSDADMVVLLSPPDAEFPISYGWHLKSAKRISANNQYTLPAFFVSDEESTATLVLADDFYFGDEASIGLLQLPQIPLLSLDKEDHIEIEEIIFVGDRADVASVSDQLLLNGHTVSGSVDEVDSAFHIYRDGQPITFVRPDENGHFRFKLPFGEYRLQHRGTANREIEHSVQINSEDKRLGKLTLPKAGELVLPKGQAMRLVFIGLNGTDDPNFEDKLTGYKVISDEQIFYSLKNRQLFLAGIDSDPESVYLPAGNYRVFATRGPEYSLTSTEINIQEGKTKLEIDIPQRVVDTPGYISTDLHVHAGNGFDNAFSVEARVNTFVAEHAEVLVSSEHDLPIDFSPVITAMNVNDKIVSVAAVEMTSLLSTDLNPYTSGHVNFFPVQPKPFEYRNGMINHEDRRLREVLSDFKQQHPTAVAQLNHARQNLSLSGEITDDYHELIDAGAFLDHMGVAAHPYNPEQSIHSHPNKSLINPDPKTGVRDIDFDAMEIINPGGEFHQDRIQALRKDWLSFLKQGFRITGTANSDSHHSGQQVGLPRTMVAMKNDTVTEFNQNEFIQSIKNGDAYGTTGPMLDIELSREAQSTKMGQTFEGARGLLNVTISSAEWIPVNSIQVQINGDTVIAMNLEGKTDLSFDLEFTQDSFVTIDVSGPASDEYRIIYPEITPYAFSNPIYVDFDQDGVWNPPGL